jgi:hypothetical protein
VIVYIVDDNETNLALFETAVRKLDATLTPVCFADPIEAAEACRQQMPDAMTRAGAPCAQTAGLRGSADRHDHRNHRAAGATHGT